MKSRWNHLKEEAITQRRQGVSMTMIQKEMGIARSTLSNWFRDVTLTDQQKANLLNNSHIGLRNGQIKSVAWHNQQKAERMLQAKTEAESVLDKLDFANPAILDLALAMLYWGEGAKDGSTSLGSSDPLILNFVLKVLETNYSLSRSSIKCYLHLRADQDDEEVTQYWSQKLKVPISRFGKTSYDQRTAGRPTYPGYKGVCMLNCGNIAIQRKLLYLYNGFCQRLLDA